MISHWVDMFGWWLMRFDNIRVYMWGRAIYNRKQGK